MYRSIDIGPDLHRNQFLYLRPGRFTHGTNFVLGEYGSNFIAAHPISTGSELNRGVKCRSGASSADNPSTRRFSADSLIQPIVIFSLQWSLGPHSSGEFKARTLIESARLSEANTKSSWRLAVVGVCCG